MPTERLDISTVTVDRLLIELVGDYRSLYRSLYAAPGTHPERAVRVSRSPSGVPPGISNEVRVALINCARELVCAWRKGQRSDNPPGVTHVGWRLPGVRVRMLRNKNDYVYGITFDPLWTPYAGDLSLTVPSPQALRHTVRAVRGACARDRDEIAAGYVKRARAHVRTTRRDVLECATAYCRRPGTTEHGLCRPCYQAQYYQRRKQTA